MRLFVDDVRDIPNGYICARNYSSAIGMLIVGEFEEISLDHDLGEEKTGYDILCWIEYQMVTNGFKPPKKIRIHSSNPVGRMRMEQVIKSIEEKRN